MEQEIVRDKNLMEKRIVELNQSIQDWSSEKGILVAELQDSKSEIRALKSVAARASELEAEVSTLQHQLTTATTSLDDLNKELTDVKFTLDGFKKIENDKGKEFEALLAERNLLLQKLGVLEAKETQYLNDINGKDKEIGNLRVNIEDLMSVAGKTGDDKKVIGELKRELEMTVGQLERKLEDKERVITGLENEIVLQSKTPELISGWPAIAASVVCAAGFGGLVCYLQQAKRT